MTTRPERSDEDYMRMALRLARRGQGMTSPNPMVGAVIVKGNRIIGRGYHRRFGEKHAEINAIESARGDVTGSTLYVNLEPCCHQGKTPPCVDAVIEHNISRVVIGMLDPNPQVNGKSVEILQQHGIETTVGVLEEASRLLNEAHTKYSTTGLPLVTVKLAQTVDGRIATTTGNSQWISSAESLRLAHQLRAASDAVMVGSGTILADDPRLTVRLVRGRNPTRIVLDSRLRTPLTAKVLTEQDIAPTIIATTTRASEKKVARLRDMGIEISVIKENRRGEIDAVQLLRTLGQRGIASVLVEGGSRVVTSLLRLKLVDRLVIIIAPSILGRGIEAVGELDIRNINQAIKLSFTRTYRMGPDLIIEARIDY